MNRPLSPFMFPIWYRFQVTSALSILHRLSGIALCVGLVVLAAWLVSVALGGEAYSLVHAALGSPLGLLALLGWTLALYYHLCSGVRHLVWDAGYGVTLRGAREGGAAVLAMTVVLTVTTWSVVLWA
jgi:succinate dehydrogenase / fumarate reductase, cytochrome b subunit